jgi:hypothetical protein
MSDCLAIRSPGTALSLLWVQSAGIWEFEASFQVSMYVSGQRHTAWTFRRHGGVCEPDKFQFLDGLGLCKPDAR